MPLRISDAISFKLRQAKKFIMVGNQITILKCRLPVLFPSFIFNYSDPMKTWMLAIPVTGNVIPRRFSGAVCADFRQLFHSFFFLKNRFFSHFFSQINDSLAIRFSEIYKTCSSITVYLNIKSVRIILKVKGAVGNKH